MEFREEFCLTYCDVTSWSSFVLGSVNKSGECTIETKEEGNIICA